MKRLHRSKQLLFEVAFILLIGLIPLLWYKPGFIAFGHDMGFPLAPIDHFLDRLYTWTDRLGPYGSNSVHALPGIFIHGLEALLSWLGFSLLNVQKLTFIFWFTLPGITMYLLLRYLHPNKDDYPIRLTGSLFYMLNHFLLQAWTIAERTKFSIIAALPLVILFAINVFHKKEPVLKNSILTSLTLFILNGGEGIPLLLSLFLVLIITSIVFTFFSEDSLFNKTKRLFAFLLFTGFFWILLNSYWVYPYINSIQESYGSRFEEAWGTAGAVSWSQSISVNASWLNLIKLQGITDWYTDPDHPYANNFFTNPILISLNYLFVILAFVSLLGVKRLRGLLFKTRTLFVVLLLVAIPLSATSHPPLGIFYDYLLVNLPGFTLFRSGFFKFGMILWLAYAYFIATGVKVVIDRLTEKRESDAFKRIVPLVLTSLFVILLFIYNYPFFTGVFFNYSKGKSNMVQIPDYIFDAKKELDKNNFSTRTLMLPVVDIRTRYIEYDWGYFSLVELPQSLGRSPAVSSGISTLPNELDFFVNALSEYKERSFSNLLKFTGVEKLVIQNDFISPDYEDNPLSNVTDAVVKSDDFIFEKSIGKWDYYDYNAQTIPRIYTPSSISFVYSEAESLRLVAGIPNAITDAFVWSDFLDDGKKSDIFDKVIIQAACGDCPETNSYNIFFSNSKIMIPGTIFYEIGKIVTGLKKSSAQSPDARIELNLASSAILISDLGELQAMKDEKGVRVAVRDLVKNIDEITFDLENISDPKTKKALGEKVKYFLSFFLSYESQWVAGSPPGEIKEDLVKLETRLKEAIAEASDNSLESDSLSGDLSNYFTLEIFQEGNYDLYLYSPSIDQSRVILSIDESLYNANRIIKNWYQVTGISLSNPITIVEIEEFQDSLENLALFAVLKKDTPKFETPNIEFVALNQTKYIVKISGSSQFVLGFNSRFDPNWSLREIDNNMENFFTKDKKEYLDGNVVEYQRRDKHILTDYTIPSKSSIMTPPVNLNMFAMGWVFGSLDSGENSERVFLLEYNNQNSFYKSVTASLVSLIFIIFLYFIKNGKNKK